MGSKLLIPYSMDVSERFGLRDAKHRANRFFLAVKVERYEQLCDRRKQASCTGMPLVLWQLYNSRHYAVPCHTFPTNTLELRQGTKRPARDGLVEAESGGFVMGGGGGTGRVPQYLVSTLVMSSSAVCCKCMCRVEFGATCLGCLCLTGIRWWRIPYGAAVPRG